MPPSKEDASWGDVEVMIHNANVQCIAEYAVYHYDDVAGVRKPVQVEEVWDTMSSIFNSYMERGPELDTQPFKPTNLTRANIVDYVPNND